MSTQQCPVCNNTLEKNTAVCSQCGYRTIGSTQSFKPVSFEETRAMSASSRAQRFDLRIVRGPQTGVDIDLHAGTLTVGRDPQCDIFLNDMTVSRDHGIIEVTDAGCIIRDNSSFNGIWVNNRMIETCALQPGDIIQIGAFCLVYRERPYVRGT